MALTERRELRVQQARRAQPDPQDQRERTALSPVLLVPQARPGPLVQPARLAPMERTEPLARPARPDRALRPAARPVRFSPRTAGPITIPHGRRPRAAAEVGQTRPTQTRRRCGSTTSFSALTKRARLVTLGGPSPTVRASPPPVSWRVIRALCAGLLRRQPTLYRAFILTVARWDLLSLPTWTK